MKTKGASHLCGERSLGGGGRRTHFPRSFSCDTRSNGRSFRKVIRPTSPVFLFFLYIKKYATWCRLSQQTIAPTLTVGLTFNDCHVSSVSSSSSRQSQTSASGTACSRLPWLAVIFPGSCLFPFEASPLSSTLVRSPRRRPPVLSTWSTTERNKEMTVHGEDDSRDPAAGAVILFFRDGEGYQLGCAGPVARLAQAFISYV